jgi:hypothetical protein
VLQTSSLIDTPLDIATRRVQSQDGSDFSGKNYRGQYNYGELQPSIFQYPQCEPDPDSDDEAMIIIQPPTIDTSRNAAEENELGYWQFSSAHTVQCQVQPLTPMGRHGSNVGGTSEDPTFFQRQQHQHDTADDGIILHVPALAVDAIPLFVRLGQVIQMIDHCEAMILQTQQAQYMNPMERSQNMLALHQAVCQLMMEQQQLVEQVYSTGDADTQAAINTFVMDPITEETTSATTWSSSSDTGHTMVSTSDTDMY